MQSSKFECSHIAGKFRGNLSSHIDWSIYFRGAYDEAGLNAIQRTIQKTRRRVAWDIGANVGNHSLFFSKLFTKVYCFEPSPDIVERLRTNIALNNIDNAFVLDYGLADRNANAEYFRGQNGNEGQGSFVGKDGQVADSVFSIRIGDDAFKEIGDAQLDFIKIDVEGFELEVLSGLRATLATQRPLVLFEWIAESRSKVTPEGLRELFPKGYTLHGLSRSRRWLDRLRSAPVLAKEPFDFHRDYGNVLAVPEE
jgi:FkbM family methyltransferase